MLKAGDLSSGPDDDDDEKIKEEEEAGMCAEKFAVIGTLTVMA